MRTVAEVAVHLYDARALRVLKHVQESSPIRRTEALLSGSVHHRYSRIRLRYLVRKDTGAVGRVVIHDEQPNVGHDIQHTTDERCQILALVIRGNDNPGMGSQGRRRAQIDPQKKDG